MNGWLWSFVKVISGLFVGLPILYLPYSEILIATIQCIFFTTYYFILDKIKEKIKNGNNGKIGS